MAVLLFVWPVLHDRMLMCILRHVAFGGTTGGCHRGTSLY